VRKLFLFVLLLSLSVLAQAAVRKNVADSETITVQLSSKDPNVISVKHDRIERISVVKGAVLSSLDPKHGVLTIKPSSPQASDPFSMLIFTESGKRYTLLILPMAIPSQDIILISDANSVSKSMAFEHRSPFTQVVTQLITHMVKNSSPEDYKCIYLNENPILFMHGTLNKICEYQGNHLRGEVLEYVYHDVDSRKIMECDFYTKDVIAVALSHNYVNPNDRVTVFRVKRNG